MISLIALLLYGCQEKTEPQGKDPVSSDSGITVTPVEPTNEDSAVVDSSDPVDTGIEDTSIEDTAIGDTGIEDTAIADSADTATEDTSIEDTASSIIGTQMSDFSLLDVNPYSTTFGATISVRDQMQSISGWYFIKAT